MNLKKRKIKDTQNSGENVTNDLQKVIEYINEEIEMNHNGGAETWRSAVVANGIKFIVSCVSDDYYLITAKDLSGKVVASYDSDVDKEDTFVEDFARYLLDRFGSIDLNHTSV